MVLQKRRSPVRGRKRVYVLAVCLLLAAVSVGMGLSRTNARADSADGNGKGDYLGDEASAQLQFYLDANSLGHILLYFEYPSSIENLSHDSVFVSFFSGDLSVATYEANSGKADADLDLVSGYSASSYYDTFSPYFDEILTLRVYVNYSRMLVSPKKYKYICADFSVIPFSTPGGMLSWRLPADEPTPDVPDPEVPAPGGDVELPDDPVKEGHTFAGWYYGTEENCSESCTAYNGEPLTADTVLHAHFTVNRHTVTLNVNGGEPVENIALDWGTVPTLPTPTRTGYNFMGWLTADGTQYTSGEPVKADTMLTAKWEIKTFTVTFIANGETYKTITVDYGTVLVSAMNTAGYSSYSVQSTEGVRLSKRLSVITEDTAVLVTELSGAEKFGDFVARNTWFAWTALALILGLSGALAIAITVAHKRG